jgi:leucine-zipper of insertion element IS481
MKLHRNARTCLHSRLLIVRRVEEQSWTLARSAFPSTLAVSALTAIALPINASLAALLAGILVGMALVGLVFEVELVLWEQSRGVRLLAAFGQGRGLFVRQVGSH